MDDHRPAWPGAGTTTRADRGRDRPLHRRVARRWVGRPHVDAVDPDAETRPVPIVTAPPAPSGTGRRQMRRAPMLAVGALALGTALGAGWLLARVDPPSLATAVASPAPEASPMVEARPAFTPDPRPSSTATVRPNPADDIPATASRTPRTVVAVPRIATTTRIATTAVPGTRIAVSRGGGPDQVRGGGSERAGRPDWATKRLEELARDREDRAKDAEKRAKDAAKRAKERAKEREGRAKDAAKERRDQHRENDKDRTRDDKARGRGHGPD